MRLLLLPALALAVLASGCSLPMPHSTVGWQFTCGRAPTLTAPVTVQQTSGGLLLASSAHVAGQASQIQPTMPYAEETVAPAPVQLAPKRRTLLYRPDLVDSSCDLQAICAKLDALTRALQTGANGGDARRMPKDND